MAASIKLDNDLADRLRRLASRRQRSPHWITREAIREYITREEALASWPAYQETGRHPTAEEVRARLDTWVIVRQDRDEGGSGWHFGPASPLWAELPLVVDKGDWITMPGLTCHKLGNASRRWATSLSWTHLYCWYWNGSS